MAKKGVDGLHSTVRELRCRSDFRNRYLRLPVSERIMLNPAVCQSGVCEFWNAEQNANTRNTRSDAGARDGAMRLDGTCNPGAGCGRPVNPNVPVAPPTLPDPRFTGCLCATLIADNTAMCRKNRIMRPVANSPIR